MEIINIFEIQDQLKPNEKMIFNEYVDSKVFFCKCKGGYKYEYVYNETFLVIIKGVMTIMYKDKEIQLKSGDVFILNKNEKMEIKNSDALIIGIIEGK